MVSLISLFIYTSATTDIYTLSLHDALPIFKLRKCSSKIITSILSFISGRLATKSNQIKERILVIILLLHKGKEDRKSGSAGMPRPISYAVFCLKKKTIV